MLPGPLWLFRLILNHHRSQPMHEVMPIAVRNAVGGHVGSEALQVKRCLRVNFCEISEDQ